MKHTFELRVKYYMKVRSSQLFTQLKPEKKYVIFFKLRK